MIVKMVTLNSKHSVANKENTEREIKRASQEYR